MTQKKSLISKPSAVKKANATNSAKPSVSAPISARLMRLRVESPLNHKK